ncbi:MAG: DUF1957 domain-containing protein [Armatimonadetes bacterium]|nr:DUF1957 domain-containing protein [Armatimonadota bacterium]
MAVGRFLLCLHSHMPYVLSHGKSPHGTDWINESAAECYLPILHALERLEKDGIKPRWTINISPILAEQLADEAFKDDFEGYCLAKINAARQDQLRFEREGSLRLQGTAAAWQRLYQRTLDQFKDRWGRDINGAFRHYQETGAIEIITCCATHGYLPLLGTEEAISAQVRLGVETHKKHFGSQPRGIWLSECAYRPGYNWKSPTDENQKAWPRRGIEHFLKESGLEYFFVDSHMIRGGNPLGTYHNRFPQLAEMFARSSKYFTPSAEFRSEYEHYALPNGVVCFARDPQTTVKVWSGDEGYPGDEHYLEFHKQMYPGRLRYWRVSTNKQDLGAKEPYDFYSAFDRLQSHARDLVEVVKGVLANYRGLAEREGTLVAMYDTELFGHWWWEGSEFLCELARAMHADGSLQMVTGGDVLDTEPARNMITLPEGSWGEGGYHYVWLNGENVYMWKELYACEHRMTELAARVKVGPAREILAQAGRELLLAESSDWPFQITARAAKDYAEVRFADHIERFKRLADLAEAVYDGHAPTAEEEAFLEECRQKDSAFAHLDPSLWQPLKSGAELL